MSDPAVYTPQRPLRARTESLRGLSYHLNQWGETPGSQPVLVMVHGWMDVGASFQFVVDELAALEGPVRPVVAPDWRGFGRTQAPQADSYWFPDYLGDLDALIDRVSPDAPVDLLGHSMGGNVVMLYAGVRPQRVRRLINLEGFGLPASRPEQAPGRMAQWLDELKEPQRLKPYADRAAVAARLQANDPRLPADKAAWLADHWAAPDGNGQWGVLADPAHKRTNPVPYRVDEVLESWKRITAPLLWVEGAETDTGRWWGGRYSREEFHRRLDVVPQARRHLLPDCAHMMHHHRPQAVARLLAEFLHA
ncbi:MAG: alpha/beta hydrolase [Rubrivivax sp.]|nr:alpha/beta hydrolase [Rubrivivax sp.]